MQKSNVTCDAKTEIAGNLTYLWTDQQKYIIYEEIITVLNVKEGVA